LDRDHPAAWPNDLGKHGRVIAGAGADLHDPAAVLPVEVVEIPAAALPVKVVETTRPKAGLAVVEASGLINRYKHIVTEPARVIIGRTARAIDSPFVQHAPGSRPQKALAWNGGERLNDHPVAPDRRPHQQVFRIPAAPFCQLALHRWCKGLH